MVLKVVKIVNSRNNLLSFPVPLVELFFFPSYALRLVSFAPPPNYCRMYS